MIPRHIHSVLQKWRKTGQEVLSEDFSITANQTDHLP